ncbi:putative NADPH:quinone oxidoreductase 2 [Hibiscus syriacus]|uniref:NAD(P)H dehydrogenase (quinone) n=1 Tax=Hibiscus syriacus TaxID=106335 RepID=A0A6A3B3B9_HIBSY|nr:putative NADPH:quinone oxidoreductase 2 [Hibiscus syriacus]
MESMAAAKPVIKVAALCGAISKGSHNRALIRYAIELTKQDIDGIEIDYVEIAPLPMLNTDLEVDGKYPAVVEAFRQRILAADSVLFASPEYNYSVTAPLKNAIDWGSRPPNVWADKAAAIVTVAGSLGGARAQYHYRQIGVYLDLHFINKPEFFLDGYGSPPKFDSDGNLIDPASMKRMKEVLLSLQAFTLRLRSCNSNPLTISEFRRNMCKLSEEGQALTPFLDGNLAQKFHSSSQYKRGITSEPYDWYDREICNNEKNVLSRFHDTHLGLKNRRYTPNARERMYKFVLVASWVFFLIVFMLDYRVKIAEDACCKRSLYGKGLDLWKAYS